VKIGLIPPFLKLPLPSTLPAATKIYLGKMQVSKCTVRIGCHMPNKRVVVDVTTTRIVSQYHQYLVQPSEGGES